MRTRQIFGSTLVVSTCFAAAACSSGAHSNGFETGYLGDDGGESSGSGGGSSSGTVYTGTGATSGGFATGASSSGGTGGTKGGTTTQKTLIYAHTDDTLYSLDPTTMTPTLVGTFTGLGGGTGDTAVTDLAVDGNGDVYVNSEVVLYKAAVPTSGTGTVPLTKVTALGGGGKFYALAFAPVGALDANSETLVGGDSNGMLWAIDPTNGSAFQLGNFGPDPEASGSTLALSGDIVFYLDSNGNPTAMATIRSTDSTGKHSDDYLAGINMAAIRSAYTSKTAAASLLGGVYGSPGAGQLGNGTGFYAVYGLGAWNSTVFGFSRYNSKQSPQLITIDTTTGAGTPTAQTFSFQNGWSGAGVTTKVTITVKPPPSVQ